MNAPAPLWSVLFWLSVGVLLLAPFYPVWQAWRQPASALVPRLQKAAAASALHVRHRLLKPDMALPCTVQASERITAQSGCRFHRLQAPSIAFAPDAAAPPLQAAAAALPLALLPQATRWGQRGWRVQGDCHLPAAHRLRGPLVVTGDLTLGPHCVIEGDIKVHGHMVTGPGCSVDGAVTAQQHLRLGRASTVRGPVLCGGHVRLARGVTLGRENAPTSVCAQDITAHAGSVVHGSVLARRSGWVA